ncbi:uncharacterized protein LOC129752324 [Uranotaenia lowii]|uniref:uncharacterized protein LOC129752324 n=1 Tax=Uranotaenia lowii TaxID=190385 RepID=UPI00247A2D34|nr:uncharacterized protein LOC129752324 [Uranotaenia lowii]
MPKLAMKLQEAVNNRKVIYGLRDAFEKYCDSFDERCDSGEVGVRLQSLEKLKKDFDIIQRQIDQMDAENLDEHIAQRVTFESSFFKIKGFLLSKLPSQINQSPLMNSTMFQNPSSVSGFHLRLPQIDLPKFDGDFSKWLSFRDTFSSMVHLNPEIPTVAKLQYLLQSLQGDARKPFETVDVLADNYESTWDAIIKRFDNRRFLKRQLFRAIYDLQPIKKECPQELNSLAGNFERHVKALAKLGEPVEFWDTPLVNLFSYKLDPVTLRAWEEKTSEQEEVKFDEMMAFIYQRVRVLNSVLPENQQGIKVAGNKPFRRLAVAVAAKPGSILDTNNPFPLCVVCPERHYLYKCPTFERMSVRQRRELISQKRLCWNCFRSGHMVRNCASKFTCRHCREHHHSMLHEDLSQPNRLPPQPIPEESIPSTSTPSTSTPSTSTPSTSNPQVSLSVQSTNSTVLLETVSLVVIDGFGRKVPARALLDSASMCNFMTKRLANTLNLRRRKVDVAVSGIGDSMKQIKCKLTATIRSNTSPFESPLEFLILKKPTVSLPTAPVDIAKWELPDVILADPLFHIPNDVDLIVGGEMFYEIHTGRKIQLSDNPLFVIETAFGWTVSGKAPVQSEVTPHVCHLTTVDRNLERALQKFWELESVPECSKLTPEEEQCEKKYCATTTRDSSGRYTVRLPLTRDPLVCLGESRSIAERRFLNLEKRLDRDPGTREAYYQFMDDYIRLQHMIKLETVDDSVPHCYLPHHPVFKDTSTTTKVRVVFDASCKTTSGFSINDLQLVGPVIQDDLLSIVLRFRKHPIAMVADIEKMYRQIQLHPDDCPYQRILWRQHAEDQIATYELQTVTYGLASAPFLATRTLKQAAIDEEARYPIAAVVFREDFYMDDCLTGSQSITEAVRLREEATALSVAAGFPLKKWASNVPEALAGVSEEDLAINPIHDLQDNQTVSTLGLVWETVTDLLRFRVQLPSPDPVLTKRKIMSYIAQIFDPLGLVGPIITVAKLIMQSLWALKTEGDNAYEWDRPLPESLQATWRQFHSTLSIISKIRVPRFVSLPKANSLQLHFFSDASEKAYGSCCYLRTESADSVRVRLLTSKSKVAPLSSHHTIARLELCGAVLSTSLYEKVSRALKISAEVYFWTDSITVLQWLKSSPARWKTFVANRVSTIQSRTSSCSWNYVPGECNPADVISRGINPLEIIDHSLWWNGPLWLPLSSSLWPRIETFTNDHSEVLEEKTTLAVLSSFAQNDKFSEELFARYSSYTQLRRLLGYWMRYFRILKAKARNEKLVPFETLSVMDHQEAERALCRLAQRQIFSQELASFKQRKGFPTSSRLKWLNPTLGSDGIIRVGGRLSNAEIPAQSRHPIVLLATHPLATLLAKYYHRTLLHAGPQLLLATIRQKFWIVGGRNLVRRVYHQCQTCFRNKPTLVQQSMADLPASRVVQDRPFAICGVDYCGPLYLKSPIRNRAPTKAYLAIFVCFITRAVHLELVSDLSTSAFVAALRRFVARRSKPREIHSDNGTQFKGTSNELRRVYEMLKTSTADRKKIFQWCSESEIQWKFIPPRSPHFGGLWEAAVKSAKHHLLREIGHTNVYYEDMLTLLAEIEMCLNSRPLVEIPVEVKDLEALTPGHFLVGENMQAVACKPLTDVPDNLLSHWDLTQKRFQRIWSRWQREYLQQLQARAVKPKQKVEIQPGRLVIVKEDQLPPIQWPLGRITEVVPGSDGVVRVVKIRMAKNAEITRAVSRIALIPHPSELSNPPSLEVEN